MGRSGSNKQSQGAAFSQKKSSGLSASNKFNSAAAATRSTGTFKNKRSSTKREAGAVIPGGQQKDLGSVQRRLEAILALVAGAVLVVGAFAIWLQLREEQEAEAGADKEL